MNFSEIARRSQGSRANQPIVRANPNPLVSEQQSEDPVTIGSLNMSLNFVLEKILKNQEEIKKEISDLRSLTYQLLSRNLTLNFKSKSPESGVARTVCCEFLLSFNIKPEMADLKTKMREKFGNENLLEASASEFSTYVTQYLSRCRYKIKDLILENCSLTLEEIDKKIQEIFKVNRPLTIIQKGRLALITYLVFVYTLERQDIDWEHINYSLNLEENISYSEESDSLKFLLEQKKDISDKILAAGLNRRKEARKVKKIAKRARIENTIIAENEEGQISSESDVNE